MRSNQMTREQFLSQYTGEWSPSDGREARFGVYKKEDSAYALIGEYATPAGSAGAMPHSGNAFGRHSRR